MITVYKELKNREDGRTVQLTCGHDDITHITNYWAVETITGLNELTQSPKYKIMTCQAFGSHQYVEANKLFGKLARKFM